MEYLVIVFVCYLFASEYRNVKQLEIIRTLTVLQRSPDVFTYKEAEKMEDVSSSDSSPDADEMTDMEDVDPEELKGATFRRFPRKE